MLKLLKNLGIINPWTGEAIKLSEDQDDSSAHDGKSKIFFNF